MARALNVMVILVVGFLLTMHHAALAQSLDKASALTQQVIELTKRGHYSEAIPLAQRVLALREETLGPDHPDVATALHILAELYGRQGLYAEAEPLSIRSNAIREKILGPDHPNVAITLNALALVIYRL